MRGRRERSRGWAWHVLAGVLWLVTVTAALVGIWTGDTRWLQSAVITAGSSFGATFIGAVRNEY